MYALSGEPASKDCLKPGQPPDVRITSPLTLPNTWADVAKGHAAHRLANAEPRESGGGRTDEQADRGT